MATNPTSHELIRAVRLFLSETARPALSGHAAFHARVAENALAIVERELVAGMKANAEAVDRLQSLLESEETDRIALEQELSKKIKAGTLDWSDPDLMDHLRASTIDQVKIDQPKYSGLAIATESE